MTLSVVVAAVTGSRPVLSALASLERLTERARIEIIVANASGAATGKAIRERYPRQLVLELGHDTVLQARSAGVEAASGDTIAILHERYTVDDRWLAALEDAQAGEVECTGGIVAPAHGFRAAEWAMYFTEYSHIAPPAREGLLDGRGEIALPGGNIAYKRRALEGLPMSGFPSEDAFHEALRQKGARFARVNAMRTEFGCPNTMGEYAEERRRVSREYASRRAAGMRPAQRALAACARLALPPLVAGRILKNCAGKPGLRGKLPAALPFIVRFSWLQMAGEIEGYLGM